MHTDKGITGTSTAVWTVHYKIMISTVIRITTMLMLMMKMTMIPQNLFIKNTINVNVIDIISQYEYSHLFKEKGQNYASLNFRQIWGSWQ